MRRRTISQIHASCMALTQASTLAPGGSSESNGRQDSTAVKSAATASAGRSKTTPNSKFQKLQLGETLDSAGAARASGASSRFPLARRALTCGLPPGRHYQDSVKDRVCHAIGNIISSQHAVRDKPARCPVKHAGNRLGEYLRW